MKKLFALLLALLLLLSLAACGGGDETPSGNEDNPPSSGQQQEQNTPDPDEGEDEPDNSGEATDPGTSDNAGGSTVADANAWLAERGFDGFTLPEDLAVVNIGLRDMPAAMLAVFCPVENAKYEEVLTALFSDTGMTVETNAGKAATSLDDCLSEINTNDDMITHVFYCENENWMHSVTVNYFIKEFNNGSVQYDAKTMCISIN